MDNQQGCNWQQLEQNKVLHLYTDTDLAYLQRIRVGTFVNVDVHVCIKYCTFVSKQIKVLSNNATTSSVSFPHMYIC